MYRNEPLPSPVLLGMNASAACGASSLHLCASACCSNQSARRMAGEMKSMRCRSWGCFCAMWDKIRAPVELPIAFHGLPPEFADVCNVMSARACQPGFSKGRALESFDIRSIPKCGSIPKNAARTQQCAGHHLDHVLLNLQYTSRQ
jgi:hypothetical protein